MGLVAVGKISEAIKFAADAAGEPNMNMKHVIMRRIGAEEAMSCVKITIMPVAESKMSLSVHVIRSIIFLPILSKSGPIAKVLKKLQIDKGSI